VSATVGESERVMRTRLDGWVGPAASPCSLVDRGASVEESTLERGASGVRNASPVAGGAGMEGKLDRGEGGKRED
jgi:hypothetical protein